MDQKLNAKSAAWASVVGIICGIMMFPVALGAMASFPNSIGWLGIVLAVCSIVVSILSFRNFKKARRVYVETEHQVQSILQTASLRAETIKDEVRFPSPTPRMPKVLANWEYTSEEWQGFLEWEKGDRRLTAIAHFMVVLILACFCIQVKSGAGWFNSFLLSLPIAALYSWIIVIFSRSSFGNSTHVKSNQVILTTHAAVINKRFNEFVSENRSIKEVRIIEAANPKILEIEYEWQTRGGKSSDRLHLPIPKGKLGEAVMLMDKLLTGAVSV
jgi:hypothetical protein